MLDSVVIILQSTPLAYKFAIILGVILVISAVCPPLISAVSKQSITLTRSQAMALAIIGLILIVAGSVGLYMANKPPRIKDIQPDAGEYTVGSKIFITVHAFDPDDEDLRYEFRRKGPATNDMWITVKGPESNNSWSWYTTPMDSGPNYIDVIVYDKKDLNSTSHREYILSPENRPPKIETFAAVPENGHMMWLKAEATDPDGDEIEYKFSALDNVSNRWDIICNWSTEYECYWDSSGSDVGTKMIRVEVRDHNHKYLIGNAGDAKETLKLADIETNDPDERSRDGFGYNTSEDAGSPDNSTGIGQNVTGDLI